MSFQTSLSGLNAASNQLAVTSNNIANSSTTGFKESRSEFADVYAVAYYGIGSTTPGNGVQVADVSQQFSQGNVDYTSNNLDMAINGEGFFVVSNNGELAYTRAGSFSVDKDGYVENNQGYNLQVYPPNAAGGFDTGSLTDLRLDRSGGAPQATANLELAANLSATATPPTGAFNANDPSTYNYSTSTTTYDSLGTAMSSTFYFVKDPAVVNTWTGYMTVDGVAVGAGQTFTFNGDGSLATPAGGSVNFGTFTPTNGANPMPLTVDFSNTTQYGGPSGVTRLTQDGFGIGQLTGIDTDKTGVVVARYSNGRSVPLGKIAMATFSNPQGLQKLGDTMWAETFTSGGSIRGEAGNSGLGLFQSGALEASNVDLTEQLVQMITAQRYFQANAQMISTEDAITQTIINIR
jgi:flagellar hook protein FlgE